MIIEDQQFPTPTTASINDANDAPPPPSRIPLLLGAEREPQPDWITLDTVLHNHHNVLLKALGDSNIFYQALINNNRRSIYILTPEEHIADIVNRDKQMIDQLQGISNADLAEIFRIIQETANDLPVHNLNMFPSDDPNTEQILNFGRNSYLLQVYQGIDGARYIQVSRLGFEETINCNFYTADLASIGFYGGQFNRLDPIDIIQFFPHLENKLSSDGQRFFQNQIEQRQAEKKQKELEQKRKEEQLRLEIERLHTVIDTYLGYLTKLKSTLKINDNNPNRSTNIYFNTFAQSLVGTEKQIEYQRQIYHEYSGNEFDKALLYLIEKLEYELQYEKVPPSRIDESGIRFFLESLESKQCTPEEYVAGKIVEIKQLFSLLCTSLAKRDGKSDLWGNSTAYFYLKTLFSLTDPTSEHPAVPFITDITLQVAEMLNTAGSGYSFGKFPMWGGRAYSENAFFEVSIGCKYDEFDEAIGKSRGKLSKNTIVVKIKPKYKLAPGCQYPFSRISVSLQAGHNQGETNTQPIFGPYQLADDGTLEINGLYEELGYSAKKLQELDSRWIVKASYT